MNYTIDRGEVWERSIVPKDKRTHRKRVPTAAAAYITAGSIAAPTVLADYLIPTEITSDGSVHISMTAANTLSLPAGTWAWDMQITCSRSAMLTSTPLAEVLVVRGTITVRDVTSIAPFPASQTITPLELVP